jgi:hypothetical protein
MKRTAVIIGMDSSLTAEQAQTLTSALDKRYPGIAFTLIGGGRDSISFEFDDGEPVARFTFDPEPMS